MTSEIFLGVLMQKPRYIYSPQVSGSPSYEQTRRDQISRENHKIQPREPGSERGILSPVPYVTDAFMALN